MRVGIAGLGIVSPYGFGLESFSKGLFSGKSALTPLTRFDARGFRSQVGGQVDFQSDKLEESISKFWLNKALEEAIKQAECKIETWRSCKKAIILPVVSGDSSSTYGERAEIWVKDPLDFLPFAWRERTPVLRVSAACSSISSAIAMAKSLVSQEQLDMVMIARAELLNEYEYASLDIVKAISTDTARPFDQNRNGILVGEGAGVILLESEECLRDRGKKPLAWIDGISHIVSGYGTNMVELDKESTMQTMREALEEAKRKKVDCIQAHATGTPQGDLIEAVSIVEAIEEGNMIPVSSHKGAIGHLLRCSGVMGLATGVISLKCQAIPTTIGLINLDRACTIHAVIGRSMKATVESVLINSFGFCGNYVSMVVTSAKS
ncbi:beta-ketoacyl synthase N-terminal-like domain-containing protein [Aneurinibacillus thermoaerophilus]|uniref:Ketoacyl-ACP synthase n=1 Tax=Aneurinibacillus thermoaerophilus TaxID=143495 RepID=A0ABX8Y8N6_ANETH|nr:beta-ketoacyl synthase N-terminal-like domain-containing protein [Aneurinibacillus thermoaerophilus]QYY42030.1 ketoacyl-ACP synthase [Aneurinibacillus thermoaerophilus]